MNSSKGNKLNMIIITLMKEKKTNSDKLIFLCNLSINDMNVL